MKKIAQLSTTSLIIIMLSNISFGQGISTDKNQSPILSSNKGANPLLRLSAAFSETQDSPDLAVVYFNDKATVEFDGQLDAYKFMNSDIMVPSLYTVTPSGMNLSINALPPISNTLCKVAIGLKIDKEGSVIFKIRDIDIILSQMRIFLTDIVEGTEKDLLPGNDYKIYLTEGEYKNRFFINLSNTITDIQDNIPGSDFFNIYYSYGTLKAEINSLTGKDGTLIIYNLLGQTLFVNKIYETGYHEFSQDIKDGIYIITYSSGNIRSSKKIIIKN